MTAPLRAPQARLNHTALRAERRAGLRLTLAQIAATALVLAALAGTATLTLDLLTRAPAPPAAPF